MHHTRPHRLLAAQLTPGLKQYQPSRSISTTTMTAGGSSSTTTTTTMATASNEGTAPPRGAFIVLEGVDRCGKTTQISRLVESLQKANLPVEAIRFPGEYHSLLAGHDIRGMTSSSSSSSSSSNPITRKILKSHCLHCYLRSHHHHWQDDQCLSG